MRNMIRVGLVAAALLAVPACTSEDEVTEGTVVEKLHDPEHSETKTRSKPGSCTGTGKKRRCGASTVETFVDVDDEDWDLVLEACDTSDDGEKECDRGTVEVSRSEWESVEVGDQFDKD